MGQLALYMLALKANCEFIGGHKGDRLVSQLKRFLEDEKRSIGEGAPSAGGGGSSERWAFSPGLAPALRSPYLTIHVEAWARPSGLPGSSLSCTPHALGRQVLLLSRQDGPDLSTSGATTQPSS